MISQVGTKMRLFGATIGVSAIKSQPNIAVFAIFLIYLQFLPLLLAKDAEALTQLSTAHCFENYFSLMFLLLFKT